MQFKNKIKTLALNYSTQIKSIDTHILRILVSMLYTCTTFNESNRKRETVSVILNVLSCGTLV